MSLHLSKTRLVLFIFLLIPFLANAQKVTTVTLTFNKTVHMFFPQKISYYDIGSDEIMAQKMDAILKLAPKTTNFTETNLTVITADNTCYSFLLRYEKDIKQLNYFISDSLGRKIKEEKISPGNPILPEDKKEPVVTEDEARFIQVSENIIKKAPAYWVTAATKKVFLSINNIFVYNDKLYFMMSVGNSSNINYDINYFKFYIVDKKKLKKASHQEIEKTPIFSYNNIETINAKINSHVIIFIFDKFTIDNDKKLVIEMGEKKGGRNIAVDMTQDLIIKAEAYK